MSREPMAKYPNLWKRGNAYYLRMRVPLDLVQTLRKEHVVRSLRTSDHRTALERYRRAQAEIEEQFAAIRQGRASAARSEAAIAAGDLNRLSYREIEALVVNWFAARPDLQPVAPPDPADIAAEIDWNVVADETAAALMDLQSPDPERHRDYVVGIADRLLRDAGAPSAELPGSRIKRRAWSVAVDRDGEKFDYLCQLVRRGLIARNARQHAKLSGSAAASTDPLFGSANPPGKPSVLTLDGLISAYENDPGRAGSTKKTQLDYAMTFRALREVIGRDKPVTDITREDCRRVRQLFLRLPPNATKRFPKLSLSGAADLAEREGLATLNPHTVNSNINRVSALFNWAVREGVIEKNPATSMAVRNESRGKREPFTAAQLKKIFEAPIYTGCIDDQLHYAEPGPNRPRRARFWVPLLSLFHGLRLNEACQLRTEDVAERDGIPVLLIRANDASQRVKSKAGTRIVPLHPQFLKIGFREYVEARRERNEERLFPELKQDGRGYYSDAFQKWFARFLVSCGAARPGTTFHSFRHGWADRLRDAHVPQDRRKALGGWAEAGVDARYGAGFPTSILAKDIASVTYPDLDLKHLMIVAERDTAERESSPGTLGGMERLETS